MNETVPVIRRVLPVGPAALQIRHHPVDDRFRPRAKATGILFDWYLEQAGPDYGPVPWSAFDPVDHLSLAPHLFLVHTENPRQFHFALHGEKVKRLFGASSWTKEDIVEDDSVQAKRTLFHCYRQIVEDQRPYYSLIDGRGGYIREHEFESIDLPMTDEDGRVVRILGAVDQVPDDKEREI